MIGKGGGSPMSKSQMEQLVQYNQMQQLQYNQAMMAQRFACSASYAPILSEYRRPEPRVIDPKELEKERRINWWADRDEETRSGAGYALSFGFSLAFFALCLSIFSQMPQPMASGAHALPLIGLCGSGVASIVLGVCTFTLAGRNACRVRSS